LRVWALFIEGAHLDQGVFVPPPLPFSPADIIPSDQLTKIASVAFVGGDEFVEHLDRIMIKLIREWLAFPHIPLG
jgi:hypothetical protein